MDIKPLEQARVDDGVAKHLAHQIMVRCMGEQDKSPEGNGNVLIFDTGGGRNGTITSRAWHIYERTSHRQEVVGYQDKSGGTICPIVNAVTKASIPGRDLPVLLVMNYVALLEDEDEAESLAIPFELMRHGISCDLTPQSLGGGWRYSNPR